MAKLMEKRQAETAKCVIQGKTMADNLTELLESATQDKDMTAANYAGLAVRDMLLARLHGVNFLSHTSQETADNIHAQLNSLQSQIDILDGELQNPAHRRLLDEVAKSKQAYLAAINGVIEATFARDKIVTDNLKQSGPRIISNLDDLKESVTADQDKLGPQVQASNQRAITLITILAGIAIVLGVFVAFFITRTILGQMGGEPAMVIDVARRVAEGDVDMVLESHNEKTDSLYAAVRNMVDKLRQKTALAMEIADGDLTSEVQLASPKDKLGLALRNMTGKLNQVLGQVQVAGEQIASGSAQVSDSSQSLSQGATEQASSLEEISSSMTEMGSQTKQNAENATQASQLSSQARDAARKGNSQMQEMMKAMDDINESGQNISKIIKVIDEIAFQTNLLALNAAVEAARAGQHGKGFAVVAEEVRNLAARSAQAAKETADLIEGSVSKAENGVGIAQQTAAALDEIVSSITKTTDLIAEIAAASNEQAQGIGQISQGLNQIESVVQQNTANAEESAAASEELAGQADHLRQQLQQFQLKGTQKGNRNYEAQETKMVANYSASQSFCINRDADTNNAEPVIALDDSEFGKY
ncbi:MAG: methyl-accepting chemotaxis protein [Deltaproteobacteria bacterium]|nr:methyl-accepting chemotaxis protein [Deltaproteobacteria bacterium]